MLERVGAEVPGGGEHDELVGPFSYGACRVETEALHLVGVTKRQVCVPLQKRPGALVAVGDPGSAGWS